MEKLQPSKCATRKRRKRRKKKKKTKDKGIAPKPPLLTFTPLRFVEGKLECKVSSKGGHKPFSKVRILLSPGSKGDDWSAINKAMVKTFSMKLGDRGPSSKPKVNQWIGQNSRMDVLKAKFGGDSIIQETLLHPNTQARIGEMDPRMNGYDGYHSSYQDCGFGYDEQQEHYMDNQGAYHDQQWNNNYQDPYSSSSQYQEPCSSSSQCQESSLLSETYGMLKEVMEEYALMKVTNKELNDRLHKLLGEQREEGERVLDGLDEMMESPIDEEIGKEEHLAHHKDKARLDEECAKGDSNELTPKALDLPKVKESLQTLLGSDDLGEFLSKVGHLKFILENKEMLGEVLQEYEEEQCSSSYMRTMFMEAPSMEKEETIKSKDTLQVEHVVKTTNVLWHLPSVVETMEKLQPSKCATRKRRKRRKKKKKTKDKGIAPKPPLLTFTPLRFVEGKLECKVSSKGGHKPFSKVRILLSPGSKGDDWSAINKAMVKTFSMKLGDRGPSSKPKVPNG